MSTSSDQDFQQLKRLLAIKRHEQPPPGYFNSFSREVIGSLRANAGSQRAGEEGNLALRIFSFLERFQVKPFWAVAFGAAACVAMIGAVIYLEEPNPQGVADSPFFSQVEPAPAPLPLTQEMALQPMTAGLASPAPAGTNLATQPSLFDVIPGSSPIYTEDVEFRPFR